VNHVSDYIAVLIFPSLIVEGSQRDVLFRLHSLWILWELLLIILPVRGPCGYPFNDIDETLGIRFCILRILEGWEAANASFGLSAILFGSGEMLYSPE
jgi:hypothetical protein